MPLGNNWFGGVAPADPVPLGAFDQVIPEGVFGNPWLQGVNQANQELEQQIIKEKIEMMKKAKGYTRLDQLLMGDAARGARSASQLSDEYQDLTRQATELKASIHQESVELANVLEVIAKQVEVVQDIGSTVRDRITSLQKVSTQLETWRLSLRQPDQVEPVPSPPEGHSPPSEAHQPVEAGLAQVAPGLWQLGPV